MRDNGKAQGCGSEGSQSDRQVDERRRRRLRGEVTQFPPFAFEREPGAAAAPVPCSYRRHEPEKTALYAAVAGHLETFLDAARQQSSSGAGCPRFIEREFRRYLGCGILANGFARLRCPDCGFERLVAFSCKGRICPSRWARRMGDTAAHLVDRVLPEADFRQRVLTFPWELRLTLAMNRGLLAEMLRVFLATLFKWQRKRGRALGVRGETGAVTFIQRFGGALNTNPHFHSILPDGLFVPGADRRRCDPACEDARRPARRDRREVLQGPGRHPPGQRRRRLDDPCRRVRGAEGAAGLKLSAISCQQSAGFEVLKADG
ncbi:MAG: transposase zinc-binding domain-containing protein [Deltaproteobacteria bacterium]|nr:transposase zinc-binding domain-containing protein [Deltaproteobacteria bacterium]